MEMQLVFWMSHLSVFVFELFHVFIHHMMILSEQEKNVSVTSVVEKQYISTWSNAKRGIYQQEESYAAAKWLVP